MELRVSDDDSWRCALFSVAEPQPHFLPTTRRRNSGACIHTGCSENATIREDEAADGLAGSAIVQVVSVVSDSPAALAGIEVGDTVLCAAIEEGTAAARSVSLWPCSGTEAAVAALRQADMMIAGRPAEEIVWWGCRRRSTGRAANLPRSTAGAITGSGLTASIKADADGSQSGVSEEDEEEDDDPEAVVVARAIRAAAELLGDVCKHEGGTDRSTRGDGDNGGRGHDPIGDAQALSQAMRCLALRDIETDLPRTFPDHPGNHTDSHNPCEYSPTQPYMCVHYTTLHYNWSTTVQL